MNIEKSLDIIKGKLLMIDKMLKQDQEEGHGSAYEMQTEDFEAIETLLTAYEKEKGENVKLRLQDIPLIEGELKAYKDRVNELKQELEKEKEKNKKAYRKANNYLYFNDSADYEVALWEVIRTLRPDLAKKWDNGEDALLKYIEEE